MEAMSGKRMSMSSMSGKLARGPEKDAVTDVSVRD